MKSTYETIFPVAIYGCAILMWLFIVALTPYYPGEDCYLYQPGLAFMGAIVLFVLGYLASVAPSDVTTEMFGISHSFVVFGTLVTALIWFFGGIIIFGNAILNAYLEDAGVFTKIVLAILLVPIGFIFHMMIYLAFPAMLGAALAASIPYALMGVTALTTTTHTLEAAKQHAKSKTPSDEVERRIAEAMQRDMASDDEIVKLLYELPVLSRIKYTFIYKVKQKKYLEMWALLKAQEEMLRAQARTARAAHEYERTKRGDH